MQVSYRPVGVFHTELSPGTGAPRQGSLAQENQGVIEIFPEFEEVLQDIGEYPHIIVLYHLHRSNNWSASVRPPGSSRDFGLFATRSPNRPNSIGFSVLKLQKVSGRRLEVSGVDAFDGTPVLDIKPWLPSVDCPDHLLSKETEKELGLPD